MCDKCQEFNSKIEHYQRIARYITDDLTLAGIKQLIDQANDGKIRLHQPDVRSVGEPEHGNCSKS